MRAFEAGLLCAGLVILATCVPPTIHSDGVVRYEAVRMLMRGEVPGLKYSLVQPLLGVPLVWVGHLIAVGSRTVVAHFNIILFLAFAWPLWQQLRRRFDREIATRTLLLVLGASMFPYHLSHYFGEVLSALTIGTAFLCLRDRPVVATLLLAIGVTNTPVLIVPAGLTALVLIRRAPAALMGTVAGAVLIALELYAKYGAFSSPYLGVEEKGFVTMLPYSGRPGFSYPVFFGVMSVIFSFGKGLLWFIPGLLTLFDRPILERLSLTVSTDRRALLVFSAAIVLVYSGWWAWYGGDFWGPRFFLILALPASLGLAAATTVGGSFARSVAVVAALTLSAWVGVNGAVFEQYAMDVCSENQYAFEFLCWYVPEFSALWRPFVTLTRSEIVAAVWDAPTRFFALWQIVVWGYLVVTVLQRVYHKRARLLAAPPGGPS